MKICDETGQYISREFMNLLDDLSEKLVDNLPQDMTRLDYLVLKDYIDNAFSFEVLHHFLDNWDKEDMRNLLGDEQ